MDFYSEDGPHVISAVFNEEFTPAFVLDGKLHTLTDPDHPPYDDLELAKDDATKAYAKALWQDFLKMPIDNHGFIQKPWRNFFPKGEYVGDIWRWFEQQFSHCLSFKEDLLNPINYHVLASKNIGCDTQMPPLSESDAKSKNLTDENSTESTVPEIDLSEKPHQDKPANTNANNYSLDEVFTLIEGTDSKFKSTDILIDAFIEHHFGKPFSLRRDYGVEELSPYSINIEVIRDKTIASYNQEKMEAFKNGDRFYHGAEINFLLHTLMTKLCQDDIIPEGSYSIDFESDAKDS